MEIELRPKFIMVDFELAIINALQVKFPTVTMCGCLFHLGQNIYRHIQKNGLDDAYRTNDETFLSLRKHSALAFYPRMRFLMPLNLSPVTRQKKLRQSTNISRRPTC